MSKEHITGDTSLDVNVTKPGPGHDPDRGIFHHQRFESIPAKKGRIRQFTKDHIAEDIHDLFTKHPATGKPVLSLGSLISGYRKHDHPVEMVVRDSQGNLKQRIHTKNLRTNAGQQWEAINLSGGDPTVFPLRASTYTGGTATAITSAAVTTVAADAYAGYVIVVSTAAANSTFWGVILTHTAGTTPVFTVDKWHTFANAGSPAPNTAQDNTGTITAAGAYTILPYQGPALWMALATDATAVNDSDQNPSAVPSTLWSQAEASNGEITSSALARQLGTLAWVATYPSTAAGTTTNSGQYTITYKWTATAAKTVNKAGVWNSSVSANGTNGNTKGNILIFEALVSPAATLASGDTLQVTWTIQF